MKFHGSRASSIVRIFEDIGVWSACNTQQDFFSLILGYFHCHIIH